jgi:RNA polymerase sigma-70 factor, ECF subfamily
MSDLTDRIIALLPRLRRFALTLTRHDEDADDLLQSTLERALGRLSSWREGTRLDSWMFKIMQNLWIDQTRSRRTRGHQADDVDLSLLPGADGRQVMEDRLTVQSTLSAIMALPEDQRAVMLMVVVEGLSYKDAADVLDVPVGTVMSRLARARAAVESDVFGSRDTAVGEA